MSLCVCVCVRVRAVSVLTHTCTYLYVFVYGEWVGGCSLYVCGACSFVYTVYVRAWVHVLCTVYLYHAYFDVPTHATGSIFLTA